MLLKARRGGRAAKYFFAGTDARVLGISEVAASALLLVITVALAAAVVSVFFNAVYIPSQSQLVLESARPLCVARVVAVADNGSGYAKIYVYNTGNSLCIFDTAYALSGGAVIDRGSIYLRVQPGHVGFNTTTVRYSPGWVYRLTGPRGEVVEGRP
jgi:hypothetical protein